MWNAQVGNHIDVQTGDWTAADSGIGAGVDSYFEYLVKGAILLQKPELMQQFKGMRVCKMFESLWWKFMMIMYSQPKCYSHE